GAQEDVAVELPAQAGAGHVAHVVGRPRRVVRTAVVTPPGIPIALIYGRRGGNIRIDVGGADPYLEQRREVAGKHVPCRVQPEGARVQGSLRSGGIGRVARGGYRRDVGRRAPGELAADVEVVVEVVSDTEAEPQARIDLASRSVAGVERLRVRVLRLQR